MASDLLKAAEQVLSLSLYVNSRGFSKALNDLEAAAKRERIEIDRKAAWAARDLNCGCDHNEMCERCFPPEFRKGGIYHTDSIKDTNGNVPT